jgi:hypothetical protein
MTKFKITTQPIHTNMGIYSHLTEAERKSAQALSWIAKVSVDGGNVWRDVRKSTRGTSFANAGTSTNIWTSKEKMVASAQRLAAAMFQEMAAA